MTAAGAIGSFVEVAMEEDGSSALLTTCRATVDANAVGVHVRIFGGSGFDPCYAVGESCIFEVLVTDFLEFLTTIAGAHSVELHDDET